jgi:hypothetical protein
LSHLQILFRILVLLCAWGAGGAVSKTSRSLFVRG